MEDDFPKFRLAASTAAMQANLPVIAVMPPKKNVSRHPSILNNSRILGVVLILLLLLLLTMFAISAQQTRHNTTRLELVSRIQIHHLQLSKAAQQALMGNATAFAQLQDSQRQLNHYITLLSQGGLYRNDATFPISDHPVSVNLDAYHKDWQFEEKKINLILSHKESLVKLGNHIREVSLTHSQLTRLTEALISRMVEIGNLSHEMRTVETLRTYARNITKSVNTILPNEFPIAEITEQLAQDHAQISAVAQALNQGHNGPGFIANKDEVIQDLLSHIHSLFRKFDDHIRVIQKEASVAMTTKFAAHDIANKSEAMLDRAKELDHEIQSQNTHFTSLFNTLINTLVAGLALTLFFFARSLRRNSRSQKLINQDEIEKAQKAILTLLDDMKKIADGNLTVRTDVTNPMTGAIADAINSTIEELHSLVEQVNQASALVVKASHQAQHVSSGLLTAAQQQSSKIEETTIAILGMSESISEISDAATESAKVAKQSLAAAEKGTLAVRESIAGMNEIRTHIQDTSKRIKRLGESSQEIGEIVALITDITDQTNVLALNAALQATAAGEAGHGFTVIAQEVQRLAERSAEASKQISELIVTIQGDTQDAIAAMERSTLGAAKGAKRSDAAGRALEEIEGVSKQLAQLVTNIFDITNTQTQAANKVVANMEDILHVTRQTTEGTLQATLSVKQITGFASELKASVSNFKV
ncbi:MAG: methyl-accepting chemotaxis protein [Pseudomonadota bacterium]